MMNKDLDHQYSILCVDDDEDSLNLLAQAVLAAGFQPVLARSFDQAVEVIQKQPQTLLLVISDFVISESKTGLDIRRQNLSNIEIPFVIVSGYVTREMALESLECKIDAFFEKPFEFASFTQQIKDLIRNRKEELDFRKVLKATFFEEASNILEELEMLLISFDSYPHDQEILNAIFRQVHTIKGSSSVIGTDVVRTYAHAYEDFLAKIRANQRPVSSGELKIFFHGFDALKRIIDGCQSGVEVVESTEIFLGDLSDEGHEIAQQQTSSGSQGAAIQQKTSKVPLEVLDHLEHLAAEVTIQKNIISKLMLSITRNQPDHQEIGMLSKCFAEMAKYQSVMLDEIKKVRTTPFWELTRPLIRIARDLEKSLQKKTKLIILGGEICLDHRAQKVLSDCLIHLVRNCLDHGIEKPEERQRIGKNPVSEIVLEVKEHVHYFNIVVRDDGCGIDPEKIKRKALEKKLISEEQLKPLRPEEIIDLIFAAGFSTAEQVTDVSGRGVGMDMVRSSLSGIGGTVVIQSELNVGTKISLRMPKQDLSVSIEALLMRLGNQVYAIAQHQILRLCDFAVLKETALIQHEGAMSWNMEGKLIPFLRLESILQITSSYESSVDQPIADTSQVVIVKSQDGTTVALRVDEIIDLDEVVIRSVTDFANPLGLYRGAALLNDGTVGLVIDLDGLCQHKSITKTIEITADLDESAKNLIEDPMHSYILVDTNDIGLLAVRQSEIYRVETVAFDQLEWTAGQRVIRYREKIVKVRELSIILTGTPDSLVKNRAQPSIGLPIDSSLLTLVIVEVNHQLSAFRVDRVIDLIKLAQSAIMEAVIEQQHIEGHLIHLEQVYSIISPSQFLEKQEEKTNKSNSPKKLSILKQPPLGSSLDAAGHGAKPDEIAQVAVGWGLF